MEYAEGINTTSEKFEMEIYSDDIKHGRTTVDGEQNKVKFRLKFYNILNEPALNIFQLSGSTTTNYTEFYIDYPSNDNEWSYWAGSGQSAPGTFRFVASDPVLLQSSAGQFSFNAAAFSSKVGQTFDSDGLPKVTLGGARSNQPN